MVLLRRDDIDIGQICDSGQCFRMENMGGGRFSMVAGDHYLEIEQNKRGCCSAVKKKSLKVSGRIILIWILITSPFGRRLTAGTAIWRAPLNSGKGSGY